MGKSRIALLLAMALAAGCTGAAESPAQIEATI
jgi:hypothetical protein